MLPASLRPLRSRNFALIWSAALVSNVGSWMQTVALGVLVTARTHHAGWTGLVAAAAFLPMGLLSPVGGAVADRLDRRRWLIVTTLAETAFAALLAALAATGHAAPGTVTIVAFLGGASAAIGFPAYQAMLPDLVPREDLLAAVSLSSAQFNLGRVVGPALAGVVLVLGSYEAAFAVNAASFLAVVVALLLVRLPRRAPAPADGPSFLGRVADGARITWAEPGCRGAVGLIAIVALLGSPFIALVPAMAINVFHRGSALTAVLVTGQGVGAVVGALALPALAWRFGRRRALVVALVVLPLLLIDYDLSPRPALSVMAITFVGAGYIIVLSGLNTVVQLRAPAEARARVLGIYMLALGTMYPVGAIVEGALGDAFGLRPVTAAAAGVLLSLMVGLVAFRPLVTAAFGQPGDEAAPA